MKVIRLLCFVSLLTSLFAFTSQGWAQDATGRIVGKVTDPSGLPVVGAKVVITNVGTQIAQTTTTDDNGYYQVLSLPIGSYRATIDKEGFRQQAFEHQALQINQSLRLDAKLEIGQHNEVVEVRDQAANVETLSDTIENSVVGETIERAPLNGRNVLDLALLQPGVTETNGDSGAQGNYSIAGGRSDSVTFLLDGGLNNNLLSNGIVFNPNPDTIAEFRILESNYSAEYGRNGGGVISVVTKSGTNEWHGSGFDFIRNDAFNANTFFNKASGTSRDVLKRNQYGATFGGPISLPKLVNGKDRFFFFVGYQGQKLSQQQTTGVGSVFTPRELNGDFSQSGAANGFLPNGPDPGVACFLSGLNENAKDSSNNPIPNDTPCGFGLPGTTSVFQPNLALAKQAIIDPLQLDPIAKKYIAAGLIPTDPTGQANYQGSHKDNNNELTMKFDFQITEKDKVSATLGGVRNPTLSPFQFATVPGTPNLGQTNSYFTNAAYSHTFSANLLNEFRLFLQRNNGLQDKPGVKLPTASQLNIGIVQDDPQGPPNLLFDNGLSVGFSEQGPTNLVDTTFGFSDTLSYIRGRHNWKMGGGVSAYRNNTIFDFIVNGEFDFNGVGGSGTGNSFADFFLGIPSQYFQSPHAPSNIRSKSYYGFVQDEWRITKRLTLNLGTRYEYNSPKEDTKGRSFSVIPGLQSKVFTGAPTGMVFPGDPGAPVGANFPTRTNWAPRAGFAWDVRGDAKTSVRGGFGMFYDILKGEDSLQFNGQPPFFAGTGFSLPSVGPNQTSPVGYFADPFGSAGIPNPFPSTPPPSNLDFGAAGFLPINSSAIVFFVDPHIKTPINYQYNLSLQQEVARNTVVEASYVGNISHGLTSLIDINPFVLGTTDRVLNLGAGDSTCADSSGNFNLLPQPPPPGPCSFATVPEFRNISNASYNSLQASLTRQATDLRYLGRTYFTLAYTYAHSIDNASGFQQRNSTVPSYKPNLFRASSDQDVRQRITFSGGWDMPFDKYWASGPKRLTQGWSLFPIVTWRTGLPFDVFARLADRFDPTSEGTSGAGDPGNTHANIVGPLNTLDPRHIQTPVGHNAGYYYFDPNSLSAAQCPTPVPGNPPPLPCTPGPGMLPAPFQVQANPSLATYGTLPRNFFRGPGYINIDMSFSKTTAITERLKIEFRAEFFNIFNHANFNNPGILNSGSGTLTGGGPGTNINATGQFGQVTSTHDPRIIQLAARLTF
jgi:outer membrane receptor protein involved in Fe transport